MGLSKRYLDSNESTLIFDVKKFARRLQEEFPAVQFACLLGSSANGTVKPHSDLDLAVFVVEAPDLDFFSKLQDLCDEVVGNVRCDTGILNRAEPVYRFEALKGRLLFTRDMEKWLTFYSRTCREYEHQLFDYERQWLYRLEAQTASEVKG